MTELETRLVFAKSPTRRLIQANKLDRSQLDKLREEMMIPPKELNKIAKEVVGREFGDYRYLSTMENRRVRGYLRKNYQVLTEKYRKLVWNG